MVTVHGVRSYMVCSRGACTWSLLCSKDNVALFSSIGPGPDGRLLPDVLGNGMFIFSARSQAASSGGCHAGVTLQAGTSMAAPLIAG